MRKGNKFFGKEYLHVAKIKAVIMDEKIRIIFCTEIG